MTAPQFKLEIGYGSTWQTEPASITWTDETEEVSQRQHITTKRGGTHISDDPVTGEAKWSLKNSGRRFDPFHTASPLFGSLLPGTPYRISAIVGVQELTWDGEELTWDGETLIWSEEGAIPVITGTIPAWPQRYEQGNTFGWVPIQAFENLDKLARAKIPRSALEAEILTDSPLAYWPLDETSGQQMGDRSGNNFDGTYVHGSSGLTATAESNDGSVVVGLDLDSEHFGSVRDIAATVHDRPGVVEMVFVPTSSTSAEISSPLMLRSGTGTANEGTTVQFSNSDGITYTIAAAMRDGDVDNVALLTTQQVDGALHHYAYRRPATGAAEAYIDGAEATGSNSTAPANGIAAAPGVVVGNADYVSVGVATGYDSFLASVALFDSDIGAVRILAHANAALAPLDNQTADERTAWVLDELGWPMNLRDFEAGHTILGPATFKPGDGALAYLNLVVKTEDGKMLSTPSGVLRLLDRYWRYQATEATVSQFTFTDAPGGATYAKFDLDPPNDELLINTARYTRRGGVQQVETDEPSRAAYGEAEDKQNDLLHRTDNETRALAQWKVATGSEPQPSIRKLRVALHSYSDADQISVLNLDIGHRVSVVRTPQGVGDPIELDFVVAGIDHDIGFNEWRTELYVSAAPDNTVELFTLGTSQLGGTHILAY